MAAETSKITREEIKEEQKALWERYPYLLRKSRGKTFEKMIAKISIRGKRKELHCKKHSYNLAEMDSDCEELLVCVLYSLPIGQEFEIHKLTISFRSLGHPQVFGLIRNCKRVIFEPNVATLDEAFSTPEKIIEIIDSMECGSSLYVWDDFSGLSPTRVHQIVVQARKWNVAVYYYVEPGGGFARPSSPLEPKD